MKGGGSDINLQTTLAASNPPTDTHPGHHPLACRTTLVLEDDGRMGCEHLYVEADNPRTQGAIDQSIAILLIELMAEREEAPYVSS